MPFTRKPAALAGIVVIGLAAAACSSMNMGGNIFSSAAPTPPSIQPEQIVGRWGLAAYQREEDRTRTEAEARAQCRQAYEIQRGPGGGVIMHLADEAAPQELRLKGSAGGKTFVGVAEDAAGEGRDREIVSFDGRVLVMRWVDADVASRYGTSVYVRCEGPPPRVAQKKAKAKKKAPSQSQQPTFEPGPGPRPNPN